MWPDDISQVMPMQTASLCEVCVAKQADTLHLTGSVIWRESDLSLDWTVETRPFSYRGNVWNESPFSKHWHGLNWRPTSCVLSSISIPSLFQGPVREPSQLGAGCRFGGSHPPQAEGEHWIIWGLQSWLLPPNEVTHHTHPFFLNISLNVLRLIIDLHKMTTYPGV